MTLGTAREHESRGGGGAWHESFSTTAQSYATRESVQGARQRRTLAVLTGNDGKGEGAPERGKLHNFVHTFSDFSTQRPRSRICK